MHVKLVTKNFHGKTMSNHLLTHTGKNLTFVELATNDFQEEPIWITTSGHIHLKCLIFVKFVTDAFQRQTIWKTISRQIQVKRFLFLKVKICIFLKFVIKDTSTKVNCTHTHIINKWKLLVFYIISHVSNNSCVTRLFIMRPYEKHWNWIFWNKFYKIFTLTNIWQHI